MTYHQIFKLIMIFALVAAALGASLAGLVGLAQAAPTSGPALTLPPVAPANLPLLDGSPVLTVTKSSVNESDTSLRPGERLTYTIIISNSGDAAATNVVISDTFPADTTFVANSLTILPGTAGGAEGIQPILAEGITVDAQTLVTVTYEVTLNSAVADGAEIVNTASITSTEVTDPVSGTVTDVVVNEADLSISKTNEQTATIPGQTMTYTIVVSNIGPSDAPNAAVTDVFPAMSGVNWTCAESNGASCLSSSGSGDLSTAVDLPVGGVVTFTAAGVVSPSVTGLLFNTASVTVPTGVTDPTPANNDAADTDFLTPQADLSISKTNDQTEIIPGTSVTYTIVVSNSGPSDAPDATVADIFPSLSDVTWTCTESNGASCQTFGSGSDDINATVDLPVGGVVIFTATGEVSPGITGSLTNTATVTVPTGVTDPAEDNNEAADTDTLTPQANLSVSKTDGQANAIPGKSVTYTIIISNSGPSHAPVVTITDSFPSITGVTWTCSFSGGATCPGASGAGSLDYSINLPVGGSVTFIAGGEVDPGARGILTNTATVTVPVEVADPDPANNTATDADTLNPEADLRVLKSDSPEPVTAGSILTYTLSINNFGPSDATEVLIVDDLPLDVTFQSATPDSPTCTLSSGDVICNLGTVPKNGSTSVIIRVRVNSSKSGALSNQATIDAVELDPQGGNDSDTEPTLVQVRPDLAISKSESADPTALGTPLTYTLHITNAGPSDAPGVVVTDTLPGGITLGPISASQGICGGSSTITCSLGSMTSGATATVTIAVNPQSTGTLTNSASVGVTGSGVIDPNSANDTTPVIATTVSYITDLMITHTDSPDPITQGNDLTYILQVTNAGPSTAPNVTVTDTLPTGVTFQSVTPGLPTCSHTDGIITCNLGVMTKNSSSTITVGVKVNPSTTGNISSTASVTVTGSTDPVSSNNSATATTLVNGLQLLYLPLMLKPTPVELSVFNDNTGGNVTFTVVGTGVSCGPIPNNATLFCGSFSPGTYIVQVTSACGNATVSKEYVSGPQTTRIFCN